MKQALLLRLALVAGLAAPGIPALAQPPDSPPEEETHSHPESLDVATEDAVLKEQIRKVNESLTTLHQEMSALRRAIQREADPSRKAALYAELDGLRKQHDMLERLLHDLVDEARATEWTAIDEALRRIKPYEKRQEKAYEKEEALRERQQ